MKILVFGLSAQKGGVESFIINYCVALSHEFNEFEFEFVVFDEVPAYAAPLLEQGWKFHVVPNRIRHPLGNLLTIRELVRDGRYDCIWYHACTLSDVTLLKEAVGRIPLRIVHSHNSVNMGNVLNGVLHERHKKQLPDLATDCFACSEEASGFMFSPVTDSAVVRKVANGIDVERFGYDECARERIRDEHGWKDALLVITVGRMHKQKNPLFLIDAFAALRASAPQAHLVYVGDGPMRDDIVDHVAELGLQDDVTLLGFIDGVGDYLSAADVFLLPSLYEGLPFAVVEAQAAGLPVVMSDTVSQETALSDDAVQLPLGDPTQWAEALSWSVQRGRDRSVGADVVKAAGFDIQENARELGAWLLQRAAKNQGSVVTDRDSATVPK